MPTRILRLVAPVLLFGVAVGAFVAASYALGARDEGTVTYAVGISFQLLAIGSMSAWLSGSEGMRPEHWAPRPRGGRRRDPPGPRGALRCSQRPPGNSPLPKLLPCASIRRS